MQSFAGRAGGVGQALSGLGKTGLATAAALGAVTAAVTAGLRAYTEAEKAQVRLEAVIRATGGAAGVTGRQIADLAGSLERSTLFDENEIKAAAAAMLTFKTVTGQTFSEAIRLSGDLASVFGGDIKSAALQLGKALEDPERGITALRRSGVSFTDAQQDVIKAFVESGEKAKAQALILKEVESQVGGTAEALGGTLAGATKTAGDAFDDLLKVVGEIAADKLGVKAFFNSLEGAIDSVTAALTDFFDLYGKMGDAQLTNRIGDLSADILYKQKALEALQSSPDNGGLMGGGRTAGIIRVQKELNELLAEQSKVQGEINARTEDFRKQFEARKTSRGSGLDDPDSPQTIREKVKALDDQKESMREMQRIFDDTAKAAKKASEEEWRAIREAADKIQEESRRAAEEMVKPFEHAFERIQDSFADMLVEGRFSFESLIDIAKKAAAEIASAMVIKPLIGGIAGGLGLSTSASGSSGGGLGNSLASSAINSGVGMLATQGSALYGFNTAAAQALPGIFGTGSLPWLGGQSGLLGGLGISASTLGIGAALMAIPMLAGSFKSRPHPASTFGGTLTGSGEFGDLNVLSKHIDDSYGQGAADALMGITQGLSGIGLTGFAGKAVTGGVDDGKGFLTVNGQTVATFDPNDAKAMQKALLEASLAMVDVAKITNEDLLKAFKGLQTEGKDAAVIIDELAAAAARPAQRAALNQQVSDALLGSRSGEALGLAQLDRQFDEMRKSAKELGANLEAVEELYAVKIKEAVKQLAQQQLQAATQARDQWRAANDNIRGYRSSLLVDASVSPLSPEARLAEARSQFRDISSRAQGGDVSAIEQLQGASQAFLEVSREYFASNQGYVDAFAEVQDALSATESITARQLREAEKQTKLLEQIAGAANDNRDFGKNPDLNKALAAATGYSGNFGSGGFDAFVRTDAVSPAQREVARQLVRAFGGAPGFAGGGYANGWAMVGENGPELVRFGSPARVYSNGDSRAMVAGNDNGAVVARLEGTIRTLQAGFNAMVVELQAMRNENAEVRSNLQRVAGGK